MSYQEQTTSTQGSGPVDKKLGTATLFETLKRDGRFDKFLDAIRGAGLESQLRGPNLMTVLAPMDDAFASLPESLKGDRLEPVLTQHVLPGRILTADMRVAPTLKTTAGPPLPVEMTPQGPRVANANILRADTPCTNGVIHIVDRVLQAECPYSS